MRIWRKEFESELERLHNHSLMHQYALNDIANKIAIKFEEKVKNNEINIHDENQIFKFNILTEIYLETFKDLVRSSRNFDSDIIKFRSEFAPFTDDEFKIIYDMLPSNEFNYELIIFGDNKKEHKISYKLILDDLESQQITIRINKIEIFYNLDID